MRRCWRSSDAWRATAAGWRAACSSSSSSWSAWWRRGSRRTIPLKGDLARTREDPSREHWLGTDELGRDVLSRIIWGARLTLRVGLIAVAIGSLVGVPLGLVSGYVGGTFDLLAQRLVDVLLAFPGVLLAIMIVAIMGTGLENVMIAVGVVSIPTYTRLVRGQVLALRSLPFVEAARALGQSQLLILLLHVLPNTLSPIIVQSTLQFATSILWAAGLSFLGLGAQAPRAGVGRPGRHGEDVPPQRAAPRDLSRASSSA